MHQQRLRDRQGDRLRLARRPPARHRRPDIILVHPLRGLQRPQRRLPVVQAREHIRYRASVDLHLPVPLDQPDDGVAGLAATDGAGPTPVVYLYRLGAVLAGLDGALETCQTRGDVRRREGRVDLVEPGEELDEFRVRGFPDGLGVGEGVLGVGQPGYAGGFGGGDGREERVATEEGLEAEEVVGEAWEGGEI